jgi:tetratricopeptide (TPR) repeat protein
VHCTVLVVDVEGFSHRTAPHQVAVRNGFYLALASAFDSAGISWPDCYHEDRGDGVVVLIPAHVPKAVLVDLLPHDLVGALCEHNRAAPAEDRIRLRMALNAGEIIFDDHGVTGSSLNLAFRLIEAGPVREALAESPGVLALITSSWFFDEVVRHSPNAEPARYRPVRVSVKETVAVGWLSLPDRPYPADDSVLECRRAPDMSATPVPHQLPAMPRWFTGRIAELELLTKELDRATDAHATMATNVIHGTGGIGKTWLALCWCHQQLDRFPDGQLFVDLRGFSPTEEPMTAASAIRCFLDALGVRPQAIPVGRDAQVGLYRSLVANRRMVIVLDNALDTTQVTPLLPGTPTCTVLVTSRNRLDGLATGHGAHLLRLNTLTGQQGRDFLIARLGGRRLAAEPDATAELLTRCGGFPLALSIVAARAEAHPDFPLSRLAAELRDTTTRLDVLDDEDPVSSLPAVLSWSCHALTAEQVEMFQLLGIAPGQDIGLAAVASLAGVQPTRAAAALRRLEQVSLIQQHSLGRWRMHDLVRLYAASQAREEQHARHETVLRRVIDFYLHTAYAADRRLFPHGPPLDLGLPTPGCHLDPPRNAAAAMDWFETEHDCLLAAQQTAIDYGWHGAVWQLAWAMHTFHWWQGHFRDHLTMWEAGLTAASYLDDPAIQSTGHLMLGDALAKVGKLDEAFTCLDKALRLADHANDLSRGRAHFVLGWAWEQRGDYQQSLDHAIHALSLFRRHKSPVWEALTLNQVGWFHARLCQYRLARARCEEALLLFRQYQDRNGEAATMDSLGYIAHHTGDLAEAINRYREAASLYRDLDNAYCEAGTLDRLAETYLAAGDRERAANTWQQANDFYRTQHRTSDSERVQGHLRTLDAIA